MPVPLTAHTFVVLRNPYGEDTGLEPVPATVADWEEATGIGSGTYWLRSLVRHREHGDYGLLVEREFGHLGSDDVPEPEHPLRSADEEFALLTQVAETVQRTTSCQVYLGRCTGPFCRHELALLIPAEATPEDAQAALTALDAAVAEVYGALRA